jgi:hypothetical protein
MGAVVVIAAQCGAPDGFVFVLHVHDASGVAVVSADGVDADMVLAGNRRFVVRREFSSYAEALAAAPITIEAWRDGRLSGSIEIQPGEACRRGCKDAWCGELLEEQREDVRVRADGKIDLGAFGCLVCSASGTSLDICP